MMRAKKAVVERAIKSGAMDRVNRLLSAANLLQCVSSSFFGEAEDVLREYGLLIGDLKALQTKLNKACDAYTKEFGSMVANDELKKAMFEDLEYMEKKIRQWAMIDSKFEEVEDEDVLEEAGGAEE